MKTLLTAPDRAEITQRISRLTPDRSRAWGTMSLEAMLAHVADQLRFAVGEREPRGPRGPLTWPAVKWFAIVVAPWPRGRLSASDELLGTPPSTLEESRQELLRLIDRFASTAERGTLHPHPMFGVLSTRLWGRLAWKHLDHHLRQFGA